MKCLILQLLEAGCGNPRQGDAQGRLPCEQDLAAVGVSHRTGHSQGPSVHATIGTGTGAREIAAILSSVLLATFAGAPR